MSYQFSLHTNTDNLHFHLSFAEKCPNYLSYGKIQYRHNGELTQEELNFFKNEILHYIEKENFLLRNKDDIIMEEKILKLGELINEKRENSNQRIKFNSIKDKEIVKLTKEIKKEIFSKENNNFKDEYNEFKNTLKAINEYFTNIAEENHGKVDDTLIKNKNKYFDNYVLNAIVNHANYELEEAEKEFEKLFKADKEYE